jgi:hypothetical protein
VLQPRLEPWIVDGQINADTEAAVGKQTHFNLLLEDLPHSHRRHRKAHA